MTDYDGVRTESATEKLRRLLDERGVEWTEIDKHTVWWGESTHHQASAYSSILFGESERVHLSAMVTPAQAIAATLGAGTCHVECFDDGIDEALDGSPIYTTPTWHLSCGHTCEGAERPSYCPNCGAKVVSA